MGATASPAKDTETRKPIRAKRMGLIVDGFFDQEAHQSVHISRNAFSISRAARELSSKSEFPRRSRIPPRKEASAGRSRAHRAAIATYSSTEAATQSSR